MRHGSLESGIGMFDYAAEMMGWYNVFHCEKEDFCQKVLKYYWPKAKSYANVFGFNGYEWRGKVDIITAGFPCQPFSNAGKRKGSEDERHIWPENMRIFREAQPTFIVCENVPGLVTIEDGMVFEQVCLDLENEGYEVQTYIIPAVATDKDHRRDRIWIVAYSESKRYRREKGVNGREEYCEKRRRVRTGIITGNSNVTNHRSEGLPFTVCRKQRSVLGKNEASERGKFSRILPKSETWIEAATRLCTLDDGNTGRLDLTAISKSKWRTESLKAAGNTIVWEIAYNIFKAIEETNKIIHNGDEIN